MSAPETQSNSVRDGRFRSALTRLRRANPNSYVVYVAFLLVFVFFSIRLRHDGFTSTANLLNIVKQTTPITVMAVGLVFVLSAGEIDISIGSVVALSSLVSALTLRDHGIVLSVLAGLGVGVGVGLVNGLFVTLLRLPSFLVTLATMGLLAGLARWVTDLASVAVVNQRFANIFGSGLVGSVPSLHNWSVVAVLAGYFVFRHTRFGAHVVATGDNAAAARVTGIRVERVKLAVLLLSSTLASVAGMLYAGRLQSATYTLGESDLLPVIAAVVIGGTRLFGGSGSIVGALVGSLIMGLLNNGLILMGLSASGQMIAQGVILLIAISLTLREPKTI
ncbi:MAG: ribose transport system permease protein [Gaiellaceae bacterium]|nr:ribose transport system permease protein [Gaiellaceae bacterium]